MSDAKEEKIELLAEIILRSRVALGTDQMDLPDEVDQAREFEFVLDPAIPLDKLEECYRRAILSKRDTYQLSVIELNQAWRSMSDEIGTSEISKCIGCEAEESTGKPCPFHKKTEETKSDER